MIYDRNNFLKELFLFFVKTKILTEIRNKSSIKIVKKYLLAQAKNVVRYE